MQKESECEFQEKRMKHVSFLKALLMKYKNYWSRWIAYLNRT